MRNALNRLADTVEDPADKKVRTCRGRLRVCGVKGGTDADAFEQKFETEMDNFFALFRRYLQDKAKGTSL